MNIAEKLKELRVLENVSQQALAIKIGLESRQSISRIEAAKDIRFNTAEKLLEALGYEIIIQKKGCV